MYPHVSVIGETQFTNLGYKCIYHSHASLQEAEHLSLEALNCPSDGGLS